MTVIGKVFTGSIPEYYDAYMVPLGFEKYARNIADRVRAINPKSVLETAAGSGVVARALAPHLSADARYVVTDLAQPMLDHATSKHGPDDRIEWQQADALNLPFDCRSFDTVLCQFGAMFFPDRSKGHAEALRMLDIGGQYIFSVWDRIETNEFADIVTKTAAQLFPEDPPLFLAQTPHGYYDHDLILNDLHRAGFLDITIETITEPSLAASAHDVALGFCHGTPLRYEIEGRDPTRLDEVTDKVTRAIETKYGSGPVEAKVCGHIVTAVK